MSLEQKSHYVAVGGHTLHVRAIGPAAGARRAGSRARRGRLASFPRRLVHRDARPATRAGPIARFA